MCGIAGLVALDGAPIDPSRVEAMLDGLVHRGPDDRGLVVRGPVALGMTRLAIVDLAHGRQPMTSEDGALSVVFNGELYGHARARARLQARGHHFRTRSDTEVLLHGYREHGVELTHALTGMYAFALHDARRDLVLLARDRVGEKPLYVAEEGGALLFASELPALARGLRTPHALDPEALAEYLAYGCIGGARTFQRGVRKLRPGERLLVRGGRRTTSIAVPPLPCASQARVELGERVDALVEAIDDAVRDQAVADVPLGCFLSGGVDSSVVAASLVRVAAGPVKTFTATFEDPTLDESVHARRVAAHLGTDHHELPIGQDLAHELPRLVAHFGEPFADKSLVPTYLVAKAARAHVKVALTGDGGDELFGGYTSHAVSLAREARAARFPLALREVARFACAHAPSALPGAASIRRRGLPEASRFVLGSRLLTADAWLVPELAHAARGYDPLSDRRGRASPGTDLLDTIRRIDFATYLPDDVLVKVDRMTMAASLESRAPLLDRRVVDLAFSVPGAEHVDARGGKRLLREALSRRLPRPLFERPKQGFALPTRAWLDGPLRALVQSTLRSSALTRSGWFEPSRLRALADAEASTDRPPSEITFRLLCLGLHLETHGIPGAP